MKRVGPSGAVAVALLAGGMLCASACGGDSEADTGGGTTGGTGDVSGGTGGVSGGAGELPGGSGGIIAGAGGVTGGTGGEPGGTGGTTDCLGPDAPGVGGYAGGMCDGVFSIWCRDGASLAYRTCAWLAQDGRQSVFEAVLSCLEDTPDPCTGDIDANTAVCFDPIYEQACLAPGTNIGGAAMDCALLSSGCPDVSEQECNRYMSVLKESSRQDAHDCYFNGETGACAPTFYDCVGRPGPLDCPSLPFCNWCDGEPVKDTPGCVTGWICANGVDPCVDSGCTGPEDCEADLVCGGDHLCWPDGDTRLTGDLLYERSPCTTESCSQDDVAAIYVSQPAGLYYVVVDGGWVPSGYDWQHEWCFDVRPDEPVSAEGRVTYHAQINGSVYRKLELTWIGAPTD